MLLCDDCDRGHHLYCLKPKLKAIPEGDWFCNDCKPKERVKSPKKKSRKVFSNNEEDEQNEDSDAQDSDADNKDEDSSADEAEEADDDEDFGEREEETPPRRTKKSKRSVDPPKKKAKKAAANNEPAEPKSKKRGLSQLLGKRKSAAEASEKIAKFTQAEKDDKDAADSHSGKTSSDSNSTGSRSLRTRNSRSNLMENATKLKESRLSVDNAALNMASKSRCKRRRAVDEELLNMFNPTALEDLLNNMMKHKDGWPFDRPITRSDAPDYFQIIKRPIDLGTVRTALLQMKYSCNQEVLDDIKLVFDNCYTYNKEEAEEYQCAVRLEKYYQKEAKKLGLMEERPKSPEDSDESAENLPLAKKSRRTF